MSQHRMSDSSVQGTRVYRYYDFVMVAFVTVLLASNFIGASKVVSVGTLTFGAGILFFPLSYIFGDILTEVYGYARARRVVWAGFTAMGFTSLMAWTIVSMPPAPSYAHQREIEAIFGQAPRIAVSSFLAFFCGEFTNSFILAKMKVWSKGKHLWSRTIGSTIGGELVDSLIFYPLAFLGVWETPVVIKVLFSNYALKVLWEVVMTPVTYRVVTFLKRKENEDYFDRKTNFTPFSLQM